MSSRFIQVRMCVRMSFLSKAEYCSVIGPHHDLFTRFSISGRLLPRCGYCDQCRYGHRWINIYLSPCFLSLGYLPRSVIAGSHDDCVVHAPRNCHIAIHSVCAVLLPAGLSFNWRLWCDVRGPPAKGPHMLLESFLPHYSGIGVSRCSCFPLPH